MKYLTDFAGQNWLITPAALAVGEKPPQSMRDQKWLLILSGVVLANQRGDNRKTLLMKQPGPERTHMPQTGSAAAVRT